MTSEEIAAAADTSEQIATDLERVADAAEKILEAGLTMKALLILLSHKSGIPQRECKAVLEALPRLREFVE